MMRRIAALVVLLACAACERAPDAPPAPAGPDGSATVEQQSEWPEQGAVNLYRERTLDMTGDGVPERIVAAARGPRYDSLDVSIAILDARGDTLWFESWPSLHYFKYDGLDARPDTANARIVRTHVDELLADDRFALDGGLPRPIGRAGESHNPIMREAIHYHLAELDWRGRADLRPADPTPPDAHDRISTDNVVRERVRAVLEEVRERPSFMYYAGGEATYAVAWSEREHAFVRIYSCC